MTPGQRRANVLQGTEDIATPAKRAVPASMSAGTPAGAASGTSAASAANTTGTTRTVNGLSGSGLSGSRPTSSSASAGANSTGLAVSPPRPRAATGSTLEGSTVTSVNRPAASASGAVGSPHKTTIIVDGPMPAGRSTASPRPYSDQGRNSDQTGEPSTAPVKKAPEIVPDDGSRPPSERPAAPKPKPAVQPATSGTATPPNRGF